MITIRNLMKQLADREEYVLAIVVSAKSSSFRSPGEIYAMDGNGEIYGKIGSAFGKFLQRNFKKALYNGESFLECFNEFRSDAGKHGATCGERTEVFFMYQGEGPKVHIFGAGDITPLLLSVLQVAGLNSTVIDDDDEFLSRIEGAETYKVDYKKMTGFPEIRSVDFCVVVTRGHSRDFEALKICLAKSARYIGMIGSVKKNAELKKRFIAEGFTEDDWKKIHTPIGIDIGASTPGEIAIAIAAEIISERRKEI